MASISKLRQRALAWRRYAKKVGVGRIALRAQFDSYRRGTGWERAVFAEEIERERREARLDYSCPCGGNCWDEPIPYRPVVTVPPLELIP